MVDDDVTQAYNQAGFLKRPFEDAAIACTIAERTAVVALGSAGIAVSE